MAGLSNTFGISMQNFVRYPDLPDAQALVDFGVRMEELGYDSLWVWDHILLGVDPHFPIIDALSLLTAVGARTKTIKLGTGILVLPLRNPVLLAKQLSSMDQLSQGRLILGMASGWYEREFQAVGVPYRKRGKIMDESLDIMTRLWRDDMVSAEVGPYNMRASVMFPKPVQLPRPPILIGGYVDRVLKRAAVDGDGWLTYFYTPEGFTKSWNKVLSYAEEAGKDPATIQNCNQLPIMVGDSRAAVEAPMMEWLNSDWDFASWSDSTVDSAIMGNVDDCVEQLQAQIDVGVQKLIFVPYKYQADQVEVIAKEIIPRLRV
jgi:probable F420-dependent oxidoreductase